MMPDLKLSNRSKPRIPWKGLRGGARGRRGGEEEAERWLMMLGLDR
jgi:hypothetical protein